MNADGHQEPPCVHDSVVEAYLRGDTFAAITAATGVPYGIVIRILRDRKIPSRIRRRSPSFDADPSAVAAEYLKRKSVGRAAKTIGISDDVARKLLIEAGIHPMPGFPPKTDKDDAVLAAYQRTESLVSTCVATGVRVCSVIKILLRNGVRLDAPPSTLKATYAEWW